jgi:hypothetical protein
VSVYFQQCRERWWQNRIESVDVAHKWLIKLFYALRFMSLLAQAYSESIRMTRDSDDALASAIGTVDLVKLGAVRWTHWSSRVAKGNAHNPLLRQR